MSTLRVSNIEAKADPSSPSVDEKLKVTNSNGDVLVHIDGKTAGITTVGINTTDSSFTVDAAQNVEFLGIVTATKFSLSGGGEITGGDGNFTGIVTATSISATDSTIGVATITSLTASAANFTGNVSIAGTLTYEDVTNVDSIGIATARTGIDVTGGHIDLVDNSKIRVGTGTDLQIYHDASHSYIEETGTGALKLKGSDVRIENTSSRNVFKAVGTACELFFDNGSTSSKKFETTNTGAVVTGSLTATTFSGNLTGNVTGNITGNITGESTLPGISSSISDTATDIFVYDTSKDSDGGAWRKRTRNTSWYNEAASSTRGSRKEFPAVAVIVAEATKVTIYDGDDPDLPMWMEFDAGEQTANGKMLQFWGTATTGVVSSVTMLNGVMVVGTNNGSSGGIYVGITAVNFASDSAYYRRNASDQYIIIGNPISDRNVNQYGGYATTGGLVGGNVNDVAMTVLPNAFVDDATGLPIPTIAVATDNGVSVIKGDETIVQKALTDAGTDIAKVEFTNDGFLIVNRNDYAYFVITTIDGAESQAHPSGYTTNINYFRNSANRYPGPLSPGGQISGYGNQAILKSIKETDVAMADSYGLNIFNVTRGIDSNNNMVAYITSDYNTGYQYGDCKGAFLSDTDDTNKTNGQTESDRSVNNNALTVYGTITKTAVATGAELVSYSGWSASNNLVQPYNSDLNFGTGDFCFVAWIKKATLSTNHYVLDRNDGSGESDRFSFMINAAGKMNLYSGATNAQAESAAIFAGSSGWRMVLVKRVSGAITFGLDGDEFSSTTTVGNWSTTNITGSGNENLFIGQYGGGGTPGNVTYNVDYGIGEIANVRLSASAPSAEQFKKMYEEEKHLYNENAKATLYGSSDDVKALAYDEVIDHLHVGTSAGRSDFQGLRRINNTTTAVTTAISAHDEFIIEQ